MKNKLDILLFTLILFAAICNLAYGQSSANWTHFRGSNLNGISDASAPPLHWNNDENISWITKIHGAGWSSPVVFGNQIWLTTASENGKSMSAVCVDLPTGDIVFDILVFEPDSIYRKHDVNSYATPTPCVERDFVYVHFGRYGTACLRTSDGSVVWKRTDLQCLHIQGPGSSPIIYKNLLILHLEGTDQQLITALDKATGETVWETYRPEEVYEPLKPIGKKAYITPIIVEVNGSHLMISNGAAACMAYDPTTGKEIWRIIGGEDSTIAMPFEEEGTVYFHTGFVRDKDGNRSAALMAVNPDGQGEISNSNIKWKIKTPILQLSTPVIKEGLIYNVDSKSILMCLDAESGETIWSQRLKGKYNSSPIYAGGYIYFSSTQGKTTIIKTGKELEIVAENSLEGEIWTTPAIVGNSLLIRTSDYLHRIDN